MLENILLNLPYFFGVAGVVLILLALINAIFGGSNRDGRKGFNFFSPGVGFLVLATILYFANPYIITFLNTLKK